MSSRRRSRPLRRLRVSARVLLRRLDRQTPGWMRWLSPLGWSLVLHLALLISLGVFVFATSGSARPAPDTTFRLPDQLTDELVSLGPAQQSGDPFTTLQSSEPPSFSVNPNGADSTATPELHGPIGPGEGTSMPDAADVLAETGAKINKIQGISPSVPFSGRQGEAKARLVRREGGTVESEKAVELGIDWLARHQRKDGRWDLDHVEQCAKPGCPRGNSGSSDVAATGLGLLPMLGAGHTHLGKGRYQGNVRRGLDWLLSIQQSTGEMFTGGDGNARLYSHAIATMALCEAYGVTRDPKLKGPCERAIDFIVKCQSPVDGGWRYNPQEPGDTSVLGWQMLALRSGQLAGLKVPADVFKAASKYLDKTEVSSSKGTYAYQSGQGASPVMSAEALLVRQYLGAPRDSKELSYGVKNVSDHLLKDRERNIYYWYYATQLLHNMQNIAWKEWNPRVRNALVGMQVTDNGCARGSWDPVKPTFDRWGMQIGRHYTTAMSILTLEVYYRYLPLYKARDKVIGGTMSPAGD